MPMTMPPTAFRMRVVDVLLYRLTARDFENSRCTNCFRRVEVSKLLQATLGELPEEWLWRSCDMTIAVIFNEPNARTDPERKSRHHKPVI